jgi:hypothetical protein
MDKEELAIKRERVARRDRLNLLVELKEMPHWQALLDELAPSLQPRTVGTIQDGNHAIQIASSVAWQSGLRYALDVVNSSDSNLNQLLQPPQDFEP